MSLFQTFRKRTFVVVVGDEGKVNAVPFSAVDFNDKGLETQETFVFTSQHHAGMSKALPIFARQNLRDIMEPDVHLQCPLDSKANSDHRTGYAQTPLQTEQ